jgi:hypothetical protein
VSQVWPGSPSSSYRYVSEYKGSECTAGLVSSESADCMAAASIAGIGACMMEESRADNKTDSYSIRAGTADTADRGGCR